MRGIRRAAALAAFSIGALLGSACVLGDEQAPGCRSDEECGSGFTCRAGACFRLTTGRSPPHDPEGPDAGDAGADDADDSSNG